MTLTVDGVAYACRVLTSRTARGMAAVSVTTWTCPDVPGGVVKTHTSQWAGPIHVTDDGVLTRVRCVR